MSTSHTIKHAFTVPDRRVFCTAIPAIKEALLCVGGFITHSIPQHETEFDRIKHLDLSFIKHLLPPFSGPQRPSIESTVTSFPSVAA